MSRDYYIVFYFYSYTIITRLLRHHGSISCGQIEAVKLAYKITSTSLSREKKKLYLLVGMAIT